MENTDVCFINSTYLYFLVFNAIFYGMEGLFENTVLIAIAEHDLLNDLSTRSKLYLNEVKDGFGIAGMSMDNPLSLKWFGELTESLIKTYDVEAAKKHICKFFNLPEGYFRIVKTGYTTICVLQIPVKECSVNDIMKAMEWYGYFCSHKNTNQQFDDWAILKFEPKYDKNANELLKDEKYLIHLTPIKHKEKIEKIGFVPKSKNNVFSYPERIYFVFGGNSPLDNIKLARRLRNANSEHSETYVAFKIDVSRISDNMTFHVDPNLAGSIYTYDNLPPSVIVDEIEFEI